MPNLLLFIQETENSVVRDISIQEFLDNTKHLLFTSRSAWFSIQNECPDLRCACAHLKHGTQPSKKLTNIKDVKRCLSVTSIFQGWLARRPTLTASPLPPEPIMVPRSLHDGLLTALHIKLDHPSKWWNRGLTLKCKLKWENHEKPTGLSPSKGDQVTTRGKEKILLTSVGMEPTTSGLYLPLLCILSYEVGQRKQGRWEILLKLGQPLITF